MESDRLIILSGKAIAAGLLGILLTTLAGLHFHYREQIESGRRQAAESVQSVEQRPQWQSGNPGRPAGFPPDADRPPDLFLIAPALLFLFAALLAVPAIRLLRRTRLLTRERHGYREEIVRLRGELDLSRLRYRHLLDNAGDALFLINPRNGALIEANSRAESLLGYSAQEIRTLPLGELFPSHHRRRYLRLVKKVLREGYGEEANLAFRHRSGEQFIGAVHARLGDLGAEKLVHGVVRDVTRIRQAELELRKRNRDLMLVNTIAHQTAGSLDLKEILKTILDEVVRNFELDGGGVYLVQHGGTDLKLMAHHAIEENVLEELRRIKPGQGLAGRVASSGHPRSSTDLQVDRRVFSGAVRAAGWRGFQAVPLSTDKKAVGVLFVFSRRRRLFNREDVGLLLAIGKQVGTAVERARLFDALQWQNRLTQASHRELEQSRQQLRENLELLEESNRSLEQLDRMKSNFLALASHELRTPLTHVLSGAELLTTCLKERLSAEEERILEAVYQGGKRLEGIVQDLLEVARLESQSIYIAHESVPLTAIMEEIRREFEPVLEERRLSCRLAPFPSSLDLQGDPFHLKKTFRRLLENAVKFTPEGGRIEVLSDLRSREEVWEWKPRLLPFSPTFFSAPSSNRFIQVTVRDSGVGIDPEDLIRVFDKFYETGDIARHFSSQTAFGGKGVGLGLTLVKGMVEAHDGMVWVESSGTESGGGWSAFHVLLPLTAGTGGTDAP